MCRGDLSSRMAKKKKKSCSGLACKESRCVLEEEENATFGQGLNGFVETDLDSSIFPSISILFLIPSVMLKGFMRKENSTTRPVAYYLHSNHPNQLRASHRHSTSCGSRTSYST